MKPNLQAAFEALEQPSRSSTEDDREHSCSMHWTD